MAFTNLATYDVARSHIRGMKKYGEPFFSATAKEYVKRTRDTEMPYFGKTMGIFFETIGRPGIELAYFQK